jgi:activator of HSP90 ATPase
MAYSTANWHWKNKTVTPWAKEWFERELVAIQVEGSGGAVVSVERVVSVDGDVELGRRKSKYVRAFSAVFTPPLLRVVMHPVRLRGRIFTFVKA